MKEIHGYAFQIETDLRFDQAIDVVTQLLKEEGFGILTEIDVQATLKNKIDVDFKPYRILGACNPLFAHRSLKAEGHIGVFLPCNVVVWDEGSYRVIAAMEPKIMSRIMDNQEVETIAEQVSQKLRSVLNKVESLS